MDKPNIIDSFSRLRDRLRGLAASILQDEDDADDALQEAFCRLWAGKSDSRSWEIADGAAVLTVKRICLDFLRRRNTRQSQPLSDSEVSIPDNSDGIWQQESMQQLERTLMDKLSPNQQKVFRMVSDGVDYDIIAMRMGISEESARQFMSS